MTGWAAGREADLETATREELLRELRRYRVLTENASDVVLCLDAEGRLTFMSSSARTLFGYEPDEWIGAAAFDLVHPDDLALVIENFVATVDRTADDSPMTLRTRTADGGWLWVEVFAKNQLDDPDVAAIVVSLRDVGERVRQERELARSQEATRLAERQFRSAFDHAPIGMALVGVDGRFLRVNAALCTILGHERDLLLAKSFQELTHPDDRAAGVEVMHQMLRGELLDHEMEKRYLRPDGTLVWAQLNISLVRGGDGEPIHFVTQVQDIGERRTSHAALLEQANHDALTGLVNRACFEERLALACAGAEPARPVALLFIDLDGFKGINDTFGHVTGDLVLQEVARRVRQALRPDDVPGRLGGDELAALLVGADEAAMAPVVDRLRAAIDRPMLLGGTSVSLTASIGHVVTTEPVEARELLDRADSAMYAEKRSRATVPSRAS